MKIKVKLCRQCQKPFNPMNSLQVVCNYVCALAYNSEKEVNKRVKQMKSEVQSLSDLEKIAKTIFQKWVRQRDTGKNCISCNKDISNEKHDAGHFFSCEQYSGLIFHEMNASSQCVHCNRDLYGNFHEYKKGLIERYGKLAVEGLEEIANDKRYYKYTREELREIIKTYKQKLKENI